MRSIKIPKIKRSNFSKTERDRFLNLHISNRNHLNCFLLFLRKNGLLFFKHNLTLFGWPPIASHLSFLLFGFIAANLNSARSHQAERIFRKGIIIPIEKKFIKRKILNSPDLIIGKTFILASKDLQSKEKLCTVSNIEFKLLQIEPFPAAVFNLVHAVAYFEVISNNINIEKLTILPKNSDLEIKKCNSKFDVTYGM